MGVWEFVVVYLAAFVLVQLVIYRYLRGRREDDARVTVAGPSSADQVPRDEREFREPGTNRDDHERFDRSTVPDARGERYEHDDEPSGPAGLARCPSCGTTNDPDGPYTFCRNCASRLPG